MWRLLLITALCVTMAGCSMLILSPIIQLGVFWMDREAQKYYNADQEVLYAATRNALNELEFPITEVNQDEEIWVISANADDRFRIKLNPVRYNVTKVSILVNTLGDKPYAEMIYRHIDSQEGVVQFASLDELNTAVEERPRRKKGIDLLERRTSEIPSYERID